MDRRLQENSTEPHTALDSAAATVLVLIKERMAPRVVPKASHSVLGLHTGSWTVLETFDMVSTTNHYLQEQMGCIQDRLEARPHPFGWTSTSGNA